MAHKDPHLKRIADETIDTVRRESIDDHYNRTTFFLRPYLDAMMRGTVMYDANNRHLANWRCPPRRGSGVQSPNPVHVETQKRTTLEGCIYMRAKIAASAKIGVLNFASATRPGGGFRQGASAQEESLARSSTLFVSLESDKVRPFYDRHRADGRDPFYSNAMIYSPEVVFFRDDGGAWISPIIADVLTCAAVNAKEVRVSGRYRSEPDKEVRIEEAMKERMGRVLELFEFRGTRNLVLGSFGTGVFQNDVGMVANAWRELLRDPDARFKFSFDNVLFAIPDKWTEKKFKAVFFSETPRGGRTRRGSTYSNCSGDPAI